MRKSTKLAILVAALVAICTMAAFAADTWKQDGDKWYCYDKDGNMIYGEARKSGDSYYYLDEATGAMATNRLVDTGEAKYYYGADGKRSVGKWEKVAVENDGDGWEYMYFAAVTGKAYTNAKDKTINSKKYWFNTDGYMVYGYVDANGTKVDNVSDAVYNYGDKTDGSAQTGWVNVKDGADANFDTAASVWFYFKAGAKIADKIQYKVASGKKYNFGTQYGEMITGWAIGTAADANKNVSLATYFGDSESGLKVTKKWIKTDHFAGEDNNKWYYLTSDGTPHAGGVDKINGKFYLFNGARQMVTGVVAVYASDPLDPKSVEVNTDNAITTFSTLSAFKSYDAPGNGTKIMFFSADADTDGSMKTGTQTITIDGEEATIVLDKHGYAYEGMNSKKIYVNGVLQAAGDSKVAVKKLRVTTDDYYSTYYLVNASGSILKNTKQLDADGIYWVAMGEYAKKDNSYAIYKFADKPYASNAATAVLKGQSSFKISSVEYEITIGAAESGVSKVDWAKK